MKVQTIAVPVTEADRKYDEYKEAVKTRKERYLEDLKKVYRALKQGEKVIDIYQAFKETGVDENGEPKLAISLADQREVSFEKEMWGGGLFGVDVNRREKVADVRLPGETFPRWKKADGKEATAGYEVHRRVLRTTVPLIPVHLLPQGDLGNYYVLWEVSEWRPLAAANDPFLLQRVNANTFIVLAEWDVTEVEKIVMRGAR